MDMLDLPVTFPLWFIYALIFAIMWLVGVIILVFFLMRGPSLKFWLARVGNRIPILIRYSTGELSVRLAKRFPEWVEPRAEEPYFLPVYKKAGTEKPDYLESIKTPVYIGDERKSVLLTFDDLKALNDIDPKPEDSEENRFWASLMKRAEKYGKVKVSLFEPFKVDDIRKYIDERWNQSAPKAYGRFYYLKGLKAKGFNMAALSVFVGLGIMVVLIVVALKASGMLG